MPWRPLPSVAFAICVYPFKATEAEDLPLQIGDHIYVIEQGGSNGDWCRGYLVAPPSLLAGLTSDSGQQLEHRVFSGIFPRNCVEVREFLGDNKQHNGHRERGETPRTTSDQTDGADDERDAQREVTEDRRRSQRLNARRLSRALSRKRSQRSLKDKARRSLVDSTEPVPRLPNAPKPMAPVPQLRVGDETELSAEEPLVDEIASCLREWHDARLHELLLARGYSQLARVQDLIKRLDTSRKQLMHEVMTVKEMEQLREDTVWDLVAGNKMLSDEVIVRNPTGKGRMLTADDSVIETTKLQANMSILDRPPKPATDTNTLHHVLVDIRGFYHTGPATLQIYLCTHERDGEAQTLSESYSLPVPLPDTSGGLLPSEQPKSLFANLTPVDIGVGIDGKSCFVVFKLLKEEPIRASPLIHTEPVVPLSSPAINENTMPKHHSMRGRRSVFGSQRKNDRSGSANRRPGTGRSQQSDMDVRTSNSTSETAQSIAGRTAKRMIGVGVIDLREMTGNHKELAKSVTLWTPSTNSEDDMSQEAEDWVEATRELARSPTGGYTRSACEPLRIVTTVFSSPDLAQLIHQTPTLLHGVHTTPKLDFSGAPTKQRNDIYLTLVEPLIPRGAHLAHSKFGSVPLANRCKTSLANMQLTLEVRKADGERIEDCVFTSSNHQSHTAWRTTAVERGEIWGQTIRLEIPTEDVPGSHIVMSIADSPHFPFALAWVPLWESDAFVRDGEHQVALYVYDEYSSSMIGGKGAYLALPPWHNKTDASAAGAATILVKTFLCSTEFSQDPILLGLLSWRNYYGGKLMDLLTRFPFVPEIEVVKMLPDVFTALFQILHEYSGSESYEDLIFNNFVVVLSIAKDRRFNLGDLIETYAKTRHDWPYASECLVHAYQRLVSNPMDMEASRNLRATLKVGDKMLKLIIETRKQRLQGDGASTNSDEDAGIRNPQFQQELQDLFVSIMALMRNPMPVLLGTQTMVIQHFHNWLPELEPILTPAEILEIATNLLDACSNAQGKIINYRLVLIINLSHLDTFKPPEVRASMIANTFRWLAPYWGHTSEVTEQWRTQVRLCCSVVAAQMAELGEESCQYIPKIVESYLALGKAPRDPRRSFSMLFPTSYPFPSKQTPTETDVDEAMLEMCALLAASLTTQRRLYFDQNQVDIPGILLQALKVVQSILTSQAFPSSWLSLHVSHHRFAVTALERISEVLLEWMPVSYDAAEAFEFDTDTWKTFFDTLFVVVTSPALAMETFPEQKRRAIWKVAGDVRELGANLLRKSWEAIGWEAEEDAKKLYGFERMGGYQVQYVPGLIGPIVEICLSVHAGLRTVAVEVLRSMTISAWEIDQDLNVVQTAMIDTLDRICREKQISETVLQKTFIEELLLQFKPLEGSSEHGLYAAVQEMFSRIEKLLSLLASVHRGGSSASEAGKIVDTLRLMDFLRDVENEEAYIRYVHQLADLQSEAGHFTEAGLALQLHATQYDWDTAADLPEMIEPRIPAQKAFERKESLYFDMIRKFEKGMCWQRALVAYQELAAQYATNTYDFSKLARAQRAMASIHERISKGDRVSPRYFRVVYRGLGFPKAFRDKEFIFEGTPTDRLGTFEDRLQQLHPAARIVRSTANATEQRQAVEGQFLQVFAVSPYKDLAHTVYQRTKVAQAVREYSLLSNPQRFATTARQPVKDVAITEQVVEKSIYTTAEAFPNILRRSEIRAVENVILSPIEAAVERTTRKTQELATLEKRLVTGEDGARSQLSESLLLSVDAHSESSVARYRALLPAAETPDNASQEADFKDLEHGESFSALDPMQNALKVALLDHALAIRRCLAMYDRAAYIATKAELLPRFEATFEHELDILFPRSPGAALDTVTPLAEPWADGSAPEYPSVEDQGPAPHSFSGPTVDSEEEPVPLVQTESRRSRRRSSLPFLRHRSAASLNKQAMPGASGREKESGRSSSRQSSRVRDNSLTRKLGIFKSEADRAASSSSAGAVERGQNAGGYGMKNRMSSFGKGE
ncbi:hypothetical protein MBLNU230_g8300t1 [Neophaeotheca triangularis]